MRLSILLALVLPIATPALAAEGTPNELLGTWEVTAVAVEDSPVQALVADDPSYMGAVLEIGADSLVWTKGTDARPIDPAIDNCDADPRFADNDGSYTITCGEEGWGPGDGAVLTPKGDDELTLEWYDGGILTLKRQ